MPFACSLLSPFRFPCITRFELAQLRHAGCVPGQFSAAGKRRAIVRRREFIPRAHVFVFELLKKRPGRSF